MKKSSIGNRPLTIWATSAAFAVAIALGLSVGSVPANSASTTPTEIEGVGPVRVKDELAALVPKQFVAGGIVIAATAPHPPFLDFRKLGVPDDFVGVDYDLAQAIAARLGITATFKATPFDAIIPGLQAGKFNALSGLADLKARQAIVTFVDVSKTGAAVVVRDATKTVTTLASLCGLKVGVIKGSTLLFLINQTNTSTCEAKPIMSIEYPDEAATIQAVLSGAADALLTAKVNSLVMEKNVPHLKSISDPAVPTGYAANPNGFGVLNANADLAKAIKASLQSLIDDGTYSAIYKKWGLEDIKVDSAVINGAVN